MISPHSIYHRTTHAIYTAEIPQYKKHNSTQTQVKQASEIIGHKS